MTDVPIPGVEPTEMPLLTPVEWISKTGVIRWAKVRATEKCMDCKQVLLDHITGVQQFDHAPGAPLPAVYRRTQAKVATLHCVRHHQWRLEKENHA